LFVVLFSPTNNIETFTTPTSLFFDDLSILKKFDETNFIKLSLRPITISFHKLFTNYFSVLCHKLKIVEEEADESNFFLEIIVEINKEQELKIEIEKLLKEGNEILAIVVASIKTARNNQK
jgi:hypothetical protein